MKILIIDNYDSFTYNLYQFLGEILSQKKSYGEITSFDLKVERNDETTLEKIRDYNPDRIIISPGPGSPEEPEYFGICSSVIREMGSHTPILGVCLGMQGIVYVFGGRIKKAALPMHGKLSQILHNNEGLFRDIPERIEVMRYHSLVADIKGFPECLEITSVIYSNEVSHIPANKSEISKQVEIMGVRHKTLPIFGIQFHPESFATEGGKEILHNFLDVQ